MDASCKIQGSIHVLCLIHKTMCPEFWVHIKMDKAVFCFSMRLAVRMVGVGIRTPTDEVFGRDFRGRLTPLLYHYSC